MRTQQRERRVRLREVRAARQHEGELRRRWFTCPSVDLFVWQEDDAGLDAFELCYGKPHDEHSLRWRAGIGYTHTRIDDGEATPLRNDAPLAVPDGQFDLTAIALTFEGVASGIDPAVFRRVLAELYRGTGAA